MSYRHCRSVGWEATAILRPNHQQCGDLCHVLGLKTTNRFNAVLIVVMSGRIFLDSSSGLAGGSGVNSHLVEWCEKASTKMENE